MFFSGLQKKCSSILICDPCLDLDKCYTSYENSLVVLPHHLVKSHLSTLNPGGHRLVIVSEPWCYGIQNHFQWVVSIIKCQSEYADVKNPHKALSFAKRASTSDSPLVLQLLSAASPEVGWKAAGSTTLTVSLSNTLSLSSQELWPVGFLYLRPDSEHGATLGWDAACWPSASLRASLAWEGLTAAKLAFIFCRERDLCKGVLLFSVSGKQRKSSVCVCEEIMRGSWCVTDLLNGSKGLISSEN